MSRRGVRTMAIALAAIVIALADPDPACAQLSGSAPGGWILTPSLIYSAGWDDNVLLKGEGDATAGDLVNVLNPRADVGYQGRRVEFSASYDGAFLLYRDLSTLNSYDQHASAVVRRRMSPHVTLFVRNGFALLPTTQTIELSGVPFLRTGSALDDFQSGVEVDLSKHTRMTAEYNFQWVQFDDNQAYAVQLRGGHSHGGSVSLRHSLSSHTVAVADYTLQYAVVSDVNQMVAVQNGSAVDGALVSELNNMFVVQNASAGIEHRLSQRVSVFGMAGASHLNITGIGPSRTGPTFWVGVSRQFEGANARLTYRRSFVPSYGFGGTTQNEELTGSLHLSLSRRLYQQSSAVWRRNESLIASELSLRSLWIEVKVGYALRPSVRVEGFYAGAHQQFDRPGGVTNQNRLGFQLVTSKPLRIR